MLCTTTGLSACFLTPNEKGDVSEVATSNSQHGFGTACWRYGVQCCLTLFFMHVVLWKTIAHMENRLGFSRKPGAFATDSARTRP